MDHKNTTSSNGGFTTTTQEIDGVSWNYSYGGFVTGFNGDFTYTSVAVSGPLGFTRNYEIALFTDPLTGKRWNGGIAGFTDSQGQRTTMQQDMKGRLLSVTQPEGNGVRVIRDQNGNITEKRTFAKPGSGLSDLVETAGYDPYCSPTSVLCWRPAWTKDARGAQTDYSWGAHGGLLTQLDPADANGQRRKLNKTYDSLNRPVREEVCSADAGGAELNCGSSTASVKLTTYWENTRLPATESLADGTAGAALTTTFSYDAAGRLLTKNPPLPGTDDATYYRYDVVGRQTWEIGPRMGNGYRQAKRTSYRDADDKPFRVEQGYVSGENDLDLSVVSIAETDYDTRRLPVVSRVLSGGTTHTLTQTSHDALNRVECVATRLNPVTFGALPASACSLSAEGSFGPDRILRNVYNAESELLQVQKAFGTPLQQNYATYTYSANGKRTAVTDANGNKASLGYDGFDRQSAWNFPSKTSVGQVSSTDYEAYDYDANGNRTTLRKRDGRTIAYGYDALNRVFSKTYPQGGARNVYYGYDMRGLQTAAWYDGPGGSDAVLSAWDVYGRQTSSTTAMGGASQTLGYSYDLNGKRIRVTWPDGQFVNYNRDATGALYYADLNTGMPLFYPQFDAIARLAVLSRFNNPIWASPTNYIYDGASRLISHAHALSIGSGLTTVFAYNPASQIVSRTRDNDGYAFTGYVNVDRSYAVNGLNQYTTAGAETFGYDANGNLTGDGPTSYAYDIENRLVSSSSGVQLTWDPLGRLHQTSGGPSGTTRFLYDGDALVAEYDAGGTMLNRYVHSDGDDDPLVWYQGAGTSSALYLYADHQGSVVATTDAGGATLAVNSYDDYGITKNSANAAVAPYGRFGYTGQAWLPDLGMYHYKARIYSPTLGRFLQTDPIGYDDQINLYAYVANDPVNRNDPDGKESGSVAYSSIVSLTEARAADNDPERTQVEKQALVIGASLIPAGRVIGSIIRLVERNIAVQNPTKPGLSEAQQANLGRFEAKLPSNAGQTTVTVAKDGSVTLSATSAGKVPGSSATYTKTMNAAGETTGYTKTVKLPSGETLPPKDKFNVK